MKAVAYVSTVDENGNAHLLTHVVVEANTVIELHEAAYDKCINLGLLHEDDDALCELDIIAPFTE